MTRAVSAPAAIENLFENQAAAEVGETQHRKAAQVETDGALATPATPEAPGEKYAKNDPCQERQSELVREMLLDEVIDKGQTGYDRQGEAGKACGGYTKQQFFRRFERREQLVHR